MYLPTAVIRYLPGLPKYRSSSSNSVAGWLVGEALAKVHYELYASVKSW